MLGNPVVLATLIVVPEPPVPAESAFNAPFKVLKGTVDKNNTNLFDT